MPEAHVSIEELGRSAITGTTGHYSMDRIPPGVWQISFQRIGYGPEVRQVRVATANVILDVALRESLLEIAPIQVTATPLPTAVLTSPQPTASLAGAGLRTAQGGSIGQTVGQMPGVWDLSTGSGIGKPVIRGLGSDRVLIVSGGQRLESLPGGDDDSPSLETDDAERIEVIRGPASVLYGSDALGGVINIVPRELPTAFNRPPTADGEVTGSFGTNDRAGDGSVILEGAREGLGFRGSLVARGTGDLHTPDGDLSNSAAHTLTGSAAIGSRGENGSIDFSYSHRIERLEIHPDPVADAGSTPLQRNTEDLARLAVNRPMRASRLEFSLSYEHSNRREYDQSDAPESDVDNGLKAGTWIGDVRLHQDIAGLMKGVLGFNWTRHAFSAFGASPQLPSSHATDLGAYAFGQGESGPWHLSAGARYDHRALGAPADSLFHLAEQSRGYHAVTANLGILRRMGTSTAAVMNLGSGFRAPSGAELFTQGADEGSQTFLQGDPALRVERSADLDLALRIHTGQIRAEASGFVNLIRDYIYSRPTGSRDPQSGLPIYVYSQGDARLAGFELTSEVKGRGGLGFRLTADYVRGDNTTTGQPLPWIPPLRSTATVRYEGHARGILQHPYVELGAEADTRQTRLAPFDTPTAGYLVARSAAGGEFLILGRRTTADLSIRNLTNRRYASFLSRYKAYALDPGFNAVLELSTGFSPRM